MAKRYFGLLGVVFGLVPLLAAQAPRRPVQLTQPINNARRLQLRGNVHPLARPAYDRGAAPADLSLRRMMLLLKRSPQQESALRQLLHDQQTPGTAAYHHWLTPAQFGAAFGPAPADLQTITGWLRSQGFTVDQVAPGGNVIQFSGTAAAVAAGFQTAIHRYVVQGVSHWANATDPSIPAALAPVVAGVVSLNNFVKPAGHFLGQGNGQKPLAGLGQARLAYNPANGQPGHVIVPGDFAILYNVAPLYSAGVNGQGQAIAIVGRSDVNLGDISDFRTLFVPSNPGNLPKVFVNGPDPGDLGGSDEGESDLDLEWSGAVAPNATIDFVVSATTDTTDGVDLSAEYIVDNNLAPVMSTSFAACEADLGSSENSFINSLYEQAAAQGITVVDSSGDSGAAGCDPNDGSVPGATQGAGVSGLASTPFDVAVGGTQFNEGSGAYWSASNDPTTLASALGPIPEAAWNESCLNANCYSNAPLSSSGGGVSTLYPKPVWQSALNVPGDGARDLPDVSFAAADHDGYVVCQGGICHPNGSGAFNFDVFAGTSASAPAFAGVMALVNQKTATIQGQADYTLYGLARSQETWSQCNSSTGTAASLAGCIFYDTTTGNNSEPCAGGSPGCSSSTAGTLGTLQGFSAGPGYDLVTGLGSMNVANLVNHWSSATPSLASKTTLALSPTTLTHGQGANITITVTQANGALGPTGDVVLLAQVPGSNGLGVDFGTITLGVSGCGNQGCVVGTENALPGGSYSVVARYGGDANFAPSLSNAVNVNVSPEGSVTTLGAFELNASGSEAAVTSATYGDLVFLDSTVQGAAAVASASACQSGSGTCINDGVPSGTVSFTNNGVAFAPPGFTPVLPLNTEGAADFPNGVTSLVPGTYSLVGAYSGDQSFTASTSTPLALTVAKAPASTTVASQASGASDLLTATITTTSLGLPPTGTVTFYAGTTQLGSSAVAGANDPTTGIAGGTATLTVAASAVGQATLTAQYSGDANYTSSAPFNLIATPTAASVALGAGTTVSLSLIPVNGFSGTATLQCTGVPSFVGCSIAPTSVALAGGAASTATVTITTNANGLAGPGPRALPPSASLRLEWLAALLGWLLCGGALLRRRRRLLPLGLVLACGFALAACGGGTPATSTGGGTPPANVAGTYTLDITASSGSYTAVAPFNLTVQ
ncbi:MAG TPA: protease pro-enzyme activation domain-containing protein [Terriglobales bacterium]|nr:protease pro-enzyme activation domain-containing protein [Terriglobales bacterium]